MSTRLESDLGVIKFDGVNADGEVVDDIIGFTSSRELAVAIGSWR